MRISHGTRHGEVHTHNGYGYATEQMLASLSRLGYEVNTNDPTADVEIWFDQPHHWKFSPDAYKIGYHPWESTQLHKNTRFSEYTDWVEIMNDCDEIWTPSPLIAEWYEKYCGITVPVYVYQHGVDAVWTPYRRTVGERFKFLHVGSDAARKGSKETLQAYREGFDMRRGVDVELTMKLVSDGWQIQYMMGTTFVNKKMSVSELVDLFHDHNVFVYPSWGEGFGLNPLQALATGMPTIMPTAWAPYAHYVHPELAISSQLARTEWPQIHPGLMLKPDVNEVREAMHYTMANYEELVDWHLAQVPALTEEYSWDRMTKIAFENLESRLKK